MEFAKDELKGALGGSIGRLVEGIARRGAL